MNYQTYQSQQLVETMFAIMMMAMGVGMVRPVMLQVIKKIVIEEHPGRLSGEGYIEACKDGRRIGSISFKSNEDSIIIHFMQVSPVARRFGIGTELIMHLARKAKTENKTLLSGAVGEEGIKLLTNMQNRGLIELFTPTRPQWHESSRWIINLKEDKAMIQKSKDIERYHGIIVAVKGIPTKSLSLPDWPLSYVEFPVGEMKEYRNILMKAHVRIVKVTESRIYFEWR